MRCLPSTVGVLVGNRWPQRVCENHMVARAVNKWARGTLRLHLKKLFIIKTTITLIKYSNNGYQTEVSTHYLTWKGSHS